MFLEKKGKKIVLYQRLFSMNLNRTKRGAPVQIPPYDENSKQKQNSFTTNVTQLCIVPYVVIFKDKRMGILSQDVRVVCSDGNRTVPSREVPGRSRDGTGQDRT